MKYLQVIIIILLCSIVETSAQKVKKVSGTYTYYAPETVSPDEGKRIVLERAKLQAIADEFGTIVSQSNSTRISNSNKISDVQFFSVSGSDVKGEWIETSEEPVYDINYIDNQLVITCKVKGKAREIVTPPVEFIAKPLRNGVDKRFEAYDFKEGDDLFMLFQSPVKGYLAIFLVDDAQKKVYCTLPYSNSSGAPKEIQADTEYILFSHKHAEPDERAIVDEYEMSCDNDREFNDFYILFSESPFSKLVLPSASNGLPKMADYNDFQKWFTNVRLKNPLLAVQKIPITITKQ